MHLYEIFQSFVVCGVGNVQKNELAAVIENCWCVAQDAAKIFAAYWYLGVPQTPVPAVWPPDYDTTFNRHTPMTVLLNSTTSAVYVAVGSLHCVTSRSVLRTDPRDVLPTSTLARRHKRSNVDRRKCCQHRARHIAILCIYIPSCTVTLSRV